MSTTINRDEWLSALAESGHPEEIDDNEDFVSIRDFADMLGTSAGTAARRLRHLVKCGKAEEVKRFSRAADGRRVVLLTFKLLK